MSLNKIAVLGLGRVGTLAAKLLHEGGFDVSGVDSREHAVALPFPVRVVDVGSDAGIATATACSGPVSSPEQTAWTGQAIVGGSTSSASQDATVLVTEQGYDESCTEGVSDIRLVDDWPLPGKSLSVYEGEKKQKVVIFYDNHYKLDSAKEA